MQYLIPGHITATVGKSGMALQLEKFGNTKFVLPARKRWLSLVVLALAATAAILVIGQTVAPKTIALSRDPLFANATSDKPAMALALSVEYPPTAKA